MTEKELRKLKRNELLEIMTEQAQRIDEQTAKKEELQKRLDDWTIKMEEAGSIAEAALSLSNVFASAQSAADEYLKGIREKEEQCALELEKARQKAQETVEAAKKRADEIEASACQKAQGIIDTAKVHAEEIEANAHEHIAQMISEAVDRAMREKEESTSQTDNNKGHGKFWRRNG